MIYLRERKQLDKAKKGLLEKWESFKAKRVEHKKTLQERRGIVVLQEASVAQREAEVGSVFRHGLPCQHKQYAECRPDVPILTNVEIFYNTLVFLQNSNHTFKIFYYMFGIVSWQTFWTGAQM